MDKVIQVKVTITFYPLYKNVIAIAKINNMATRGLHLVRHLDNPRRVRVYRRQFDPFDSYTERELRSRYHFGRAGINFIADLIADKVSPMTRRNHSSTKEKILIILRFLLSGSFLEVIGDTL